jgi:DNA-damage-inducible protein J
MKTVTLRTEKNKKNKVANINVRIDYQLKHDAEEILDEIGLNMSTTVNVLLKAIVAHNGLPFKLEAKRPNRETVEAIHEIESGGGHVCNSISEFN